MNNRELEELLRRTAVSESREDVKIRLLTHLAEENRQVPIQKYQWWMRTALAGWGVAGIAALVAVLLFQSSKFDPPQANRETPVATRGFPNATEEASNDESETPRFEIDSNEPVQIRHPWSSTVILLTDLPTNRRESLPVGGRFSPAISQ